MKDILVRELKTEERGEALELVWRVFTEYVAPDYGPEGTEEVRSSLASESFLQRLRFYGAFIEGRLAGVTATRSEGCHIALFFVEGEYQRQGIGRAMMRTVIRKARGRRITVNSSPFALPVYRSFGFRETGKEQCVNGVRFTPMALDRIRI